jgi:adenosylcobinamide-phosphate synthase
MEWQPILSSTAAMILGAFVLDLVIGDPRWLPHPVVLMGKVISNAERVLRTGNAGRDLMAGMALSLSIVGLSFGAAWALLDVFHLMPYWLFLISSAALASTTLSTRGLLDAIKSVEAPLIAGDIRAAREKLSLVVGRDTMDLNQDKVLRAGLESLAESTCDGIVAPLFYLFLGGIPLAMAYKAVNTLDSMIGYRNERYFYFGKFAARLDDAINLIPARLTAIFMVVAASAAHLNAARALHAVWRDHANHLSPNAGYPEAALAGAFGIRLGGPSIYFGKVVHKPYLGDDLRPVRIEMLKEGRVLCLLTAILSLATFALLSAMRE